MLLNLTGRILPVRAFFVTCLFDVTLFLSFFQATDTYLAEKLAINANAATVTGSQNPSAQSRPSNRPSLADTWSTVCPPQRIPPTVRGG